MFDFLKAKTSDQDPRSDNAKALGIPEGEFVHMTYASRDVPLPADFLSTASPPPDARPVTITPIDWASTPLPGNKGCYAVVLDNVLTPGECAELLRLAESSVDVARTSPSPAAAGGGPWIPAMVNAGGGLEVLESRYRNSDRIVWDNQEVVDRLWARCTQGRAGEVLREQLGVLGGDGSLECFERKTSHFRYVKQKWEFSKVNKRMRFLRYGPGQFFRPHCDGSYSEEVDGDRFSTFFTLQLYLNDSVASVGQDADLVGGATSFLSSDDERKRVDVDPKAGRVLIFQHRRLYHAGDDVVKGTKYAMRTDILYKLVKPEESETEKPNK